MKYRLWDTDVGRLVGTYDGTDEPLGVVLVFIDAYGDEYAENLTLAPEGDGGKAGEPRSGHELVAMARALEAEHPRSAERRGELITSRSRGGYGEGLPMAAKGYQCANDQQRGAVTTPARDNKRRSV